MNAYRFNSGKEPTDEMLAQIMREVSADAKKVMKKQPTTAGTSRELSYPEEKLRI